MPLEKITTQQMDAKGVCAAPDILNGTPAQNKSIFDRMVRQLIAPAYNACVDLVNTLETAEDTRQAAEALRVSAENLRAAAEKARDNAESGRITAEEARAEAERLRVSAEKLRADVEVLRIQAEEERISNETARKQSEKTRAEAEESRQAAENTRESNERLREYAEIDREDAETGRASAEGQRASAEGQRASAEGQRASAEGQRASAEVSRVTAEENRVTAEQNRAEAERLRSAADRNRDIAETQRIAAEEDRASAEAARSVWEDYNAGKAYVPGNKVAYEGSSYLNISACAGIEPTNTDYWLLIARKGDSGTGDGGGDYLPIEGGILTGDLGILDGKKVLFKSVTSVDTSGNPVSYKIVAGLMIKKSLENIGTDSDGTIHAVDDISQLIFLAQAIKIAKNGDNGVPGMLMSGSRIGMLGDPVYKEDAATKQYVDGQKYTLPIAGPSKLGGVQPAAKTEAMTQAIGVDDAGALWTAPGGGSADKPWRLIRDITTEEDVRSITFDTDDSGNGFKLDEIYICTNATNISTQTAAGAFCVNANDKSISYLGTSTPSSIGFGKTGESGRNWMWMHNLNPLIVLHGVWVTTNSAAQKNTYCIQPYIFGESENPYAFGEKISKVDISCVNSVSTFAAGSRFLVYGR